MPKAGRTHDITIADKSSGSPIKGFMLWRDQEQRGRGFQVSDFGAVAPRVMSDAALTHAHFKPEAETIWYQEDWRAGMGGRNHRDNPQQTLKSLQINTSEPHSAKLAGVLKKTTAGTGPTANTPVGGFAVVGTEVWSFIGRDVYAWNYTDEDWDKGTAPSSDVAWFCRNGVEFGLNTFVPRWHATQNHPGLFMYKSDADANWTTSTLSSTDQVGGSAAEIGPGDYKYFAVTYESDGTERFWGGHTWSATDTGTAVSTASVADDGTSFAVGSVTHIAADADATGLVEKSVIQIGADRMIVTGISGTTLTVQRNYGGTGGVVFGTAIGGAGTPEDVYYLTRQPHQIRSSTDPTNSGSFSSAVSIGGSDSEITALVGYGPALYVFKTDGIYVYHREAGTTEKILDMSGYAHPDNFKGATAWQGHIFVPMPSGGFYELVGNTLVDISEELTQYFKSVSTATPPFNRVTAITGDDQNIYLLIAVGTVLHMLSGRYVDNEWRWHQALAAANGFTSGEYDTIFAEGVPSGTKTHHRVWIGGTQSGTERPLFVPLDEEDEEFEYEYSQSGSGTSSGNTFLETTEFDANLVNVDKLFVSLTLRGTFTSNHYVEVQYSLDRGGTWVYLNTNAAGSRFTSDDTEIFFLAEVAKEHIRFRIHFLKSGAGNTTTTAVLSSLLLRCKIRPESLQSLPMSVYLADRQKLLNGARQSTVKGDLSQLRAWNKGAAEVSLAVQEDDVTAYDVVFMPGSLNVREVARRRGARGEYLASFVLLEARNDVLT